MLGKGNKKEAKKLDGRGVGAVSLGSGGSSKHLSGT